MEARQALAEEVATIELDLWQGEEAVRAYRARFEGRWLVAPDPDETRSAEWNDAGAYFGVALTAQDAILVYIAHCNDGWAPRYKVYGSVAEASMDDWPMDILAAAAEQLGENFAVKLDV